MTRLRLCEAGLDLKRPLAVSYPLEHWKTFVGIAARPLYPNLSPSRRTGGWASHFLGGFLQTSMGQIVGGLAPMIGLRRMLERISQELRSGNNFTEVRLVALSPRHVELWMNDVLATYPPSWRASSSGPSSSPARATSTWTCAPSMAPPAPSTSAGARPSSPRPSMAEAGAVAYR